MPLTQKHFSRFKEPLAVVPHLAEAQTVSFRELLERGIADIFREFSPLSDYSGKKFELHFSNITVGEPEFDEYHAKENKLTYKAPLKARVKLINKALKSTKEQEVFLADFPMMTDHGTFVVNGIERVIVPQLIRSFGVLFSVQDIKGEQYFGAKIIPARGVWIEVETDQHNVLWARIDRKRKFAVTDLLRVLGARDDAAIRSLFQNVPNAAEYIEATLERDLAHAVDDSYIEIYKKLRDGDMATVENARELIDAVLSAERYDLSDVGRFRFNQRFDKGLAKKDLERRTLNLDDIVAILAHVITLNETPDAEPDDIDHLGSRRVRYVGEMLQQKIRVGLTRMKRNIQDRMSIVETDTTLPTQFINPRPLQAQLKEFFTTNQLSQFMQQENNLHEIEHLRTLSAMGPGGLTRERAGFEVRDVHPSHYGRLCPIHTPEGPNIGLVLRLATYARINSFGMIEAPYARVVSGRLTGEVTYLNALEEEQYRIAHAGTSYSADGTITDERVEVRHQAKPRFVSHDEVDFMDVATNQAYSVATSMIPFLNHDDANRALMGSNMQKQAIPCVRPDVPLVATGIEEKAARDSGRLVVAGEAGIVTYVDARRIEVKDKDGKKHGYNLVNFSRTNSFTAAHHRPVVAVGQKVKRGDVLADTASTKDGQMALGQNVLVAFMSWSGMNFEDAVIVSERLVQNSTFTSIHVEEFVCSVRDTKLGPEVTTHDIPNVGEVKLRNLDEEGIVRIGSEVRPGDILVGKVTPKGETQLTPEERLLRSIFGDKAKDVKDTSLRLESGKRGRVIGVKVFSRENGDELESGTVKKIYIEVAQLRPVSVGDKLAGRHGNKGVISKVLPIEDMPRMEDGTPVDVILTPLGVPSRMNLGQILEMHLGLAAHTLNYQGIVPAFAGPTVEEIRDELVRAGFPESGKVKLYDGRTGEPFENDIAVGYMYILKLEHMVEDKIHMRSIGPYSLITQQPLGGRAQRGGQRFGEMEVWALLGYGAAHTLREMLTIKSDDIVGRSAAFDAIVKGEPLPSPHTPASFNVLMHYLRGLALDVDIATRDEQ